MKKYVFFLSIILSLSVQAVDYKFGLGAVLGSPTGLSANYFLSPSRTIHSVLSYSLSGDNELYLASHYTIRRPDDLKFPEFKLGWFYGVGAQFETQEHEHRKYHHDHYDTYFGPSGTLGLYYDVKAIPIEVFLKSNFAVYVVQDTNVQLDLMLGVHYNF